MKAFSILRQTFRGDSNTPEVEEMEMTDMRTVEAAEECQPNLLSGLQQYDPEEVEQQFRRMEDQTVILSVEEFHSAVYANNYEVVFDSLRSDIVPETNFAQLFLDMARRSKREMALLLATKVPNLAVLDHWGENALTIAAKQGDISFAYSLLQRGLPLNLRNSENQTPYEVAALYGNKPFCKFCKNFAAAQNVPVM